jgi:hypothetical protein
MTVDEQLLRELHNSICISFGTTEPYAIGKTSAERVGFAQIPSTATRVNCREQDVSSLVPIVRQRVYAELAERGWSHEDLEFKPCVREERGGRGVMFRDENEASESLGQRKRGHEYTFHFDMRQELAKATFAGFGSFKPLPDRRES